MISKKKSKSLKRIEKRRQKIVEALLEYPEIRITVLAETLSINKATIYRDFVYFENTGEEAYIKWHEYAKERGTRSFLRQNRIRLFHRKHPYIPPKGIAEALELDFELVLKDLDHIRYTEKDKKEKDKTIINRTTPVIVRQKKIMEYCEEHPDASYKDIAKHLGCTTPIVGRLIKDIRKDFNAEIRDKYAVLITTRIKDLQERIDFCDIQLHLCVDRDPRTGSRWMEESRKLIDMINRLLDLYPKMQVVQQNNVIINSEQKDAVDKLFNDAAQGSLFSKGLDFKSEEKVIECEQQIDP